MTLGFRILIGGRTVNKRLEEGLHTVDLDSVTFYHRQPYTFPRHITANKELFSMKRTSIRLIGIVLFTTAAFAQMGPPKPGPELKKLSLIHI